MKVIFVRTKKEANFYLCTCLCVHVHFCMYTYILADQFIAPECNCSLNSRITTREWFIATAWVDVFGKNGGFFLCLAEEENRFFTLKKWLGYN